MSLEGPPIPPNPRLTAHKHLQRPPNTLAQKSALTEKPLNVSASQSGVHMAFLFFYLASLHVTTAAQSIHSTGGEGILVSSGSLRKHSVALVYSVLTALARYSSRNVDSPLHLMGLSSAAYTSLPRSPHHRH